jgi:signal transduction histidine kinase
MEKPTNKWIIFGLVAALVLSITGMVVTITSYKTSQNHAIKMGEEQLTKINNYVSKLFSLEINNYSKSLHNYEGDSLANNGQTLDNLTRISRSFTSNEVATGIYLVDVQGNFLDGQNIKNGALQQATTLPNQISKDTDYQEALAGQVTQNGQDYFAKGSSYINLYQSVKDSNGNTQAVLIVPLNIEQIYKSTLQANGDQKKGYSMIKNDQLKVVAHPSENQIGLNIIEGRKKLYPNLDYSSLKVLEQYQTSKKSGVLHYYSYWWPEKNLEKVLKLTAFKWITIGNAKFIVASNSDFKTRSGMIYQEILIIAGLLALLLAVILLLSLNLRSFMRRNKAYLANQKLIAEQQIAKEKHVLEKRLLQDSKLETVGLLTSTIVHDMNNFLTPLMGNLELLMEEHADEPELLADLTEVYEAAVRGSDLSKNVLRFSSATDTKFETLAIADVVTEAAQTMTFLIPKTARLTIAAVPAGSARFEREDLKVILYNLITNAYQASLKKAKITITVEPAKSDYLHQFKSHAVTYQKKQFAMITVADNGPGIPEDLKEQIFEPFFTTKGSNGGTGLGLFTVSSIVKKNNWVLIIETSEKGTKFIIGIPLENDA